MRAPFSAAFAFSVWCAAATAQLPTDSPPRPWTLLIYGAADNNAEGPILHFLDGLRKAIDDDPGIELLLLLDRSERFSSDATVLGEDFTGARLYRLRKDKAERLAGGEMLPSLTLEADPEIDSADADQLRRFIAWGKANYPAQRYGLMIYSHADARTMCPDEQSKHVMGIPELARVLTEKESIDFLALELCNMGGVEIAYEWRKAKGRFGADVLVAIPNAGPPLDWDRAFARIRSPGHASPAPAPHLDPATMTAADFGRLVIEEGRRGRELHAEERPGQAKHEAAGCYDLGQAVAVKQALDAFAVALAAGDEKDAFFVARGPGADGEAMNYDGDGPLVDLYDLCRRAAASTALSAATQEKARAAMAATDAFVLASFGMSGYAGFEEGKNGVFVVLPRNTAGRWRNFRWYTPTEFTVNDKNVGTWSFLVDGAVPGNDKVDNWFELLDAWFDERDGKGGINKYRF
jgi:clostripain